MKLVLHPPAKINLTLRVGAVRNDGFHPVQTILQSIALSDRLTLRPTRGALQLEAQPAGLPADRRNLVRRAADLLWRAAGRRGEPHGVSIRLDKAIPIGAGLGGGSADAAAALAGLNAIWRTRLPRADLLALAGEIGSDVPFFLVGGTALALGRGEQVYPLADAAPLRLVIVQPPLEVSTADAYRWFDESGGGGPAPARPLDLGWPTGPVQVINDLEEPVSRRHPLIRDAIVALDRAGAIPAAMSGSGSCVFGVMPAARVARGTIDGLKQPGWRVIATRTLSRRAALRRMGLC